MKKNIILLFSLILTISCSNNLNYNERDKVNIKVQVLYETTNEAKTRHPDIGATVFIYYNRYSTNLANYHYQTEGKFIKGDSVVIPDQTAIINEDGNAIITPKYIDKEITIVVKSKYYTDKFAISSYSSSTKDIIQTNIFKP